VKKWIAMMLVMALCLSMLACAADRQEPEPSEAVAATDPTIQEPEVEVEVDTPEEAAMQSYMAQLSAFMHGHVTEEVDEDGYHFFYRFSPKQREVYLLNGMYQVMSYAPVGLNLRFVTTGNRLTLDIKRGPFESLLADLANQPLTFYQQYGAAAVRDAWTPAPETNELGDVHLFDSVQLQVDGEPVSLTPVADGVLEFQFDHPEKETVEVSVYFPVIINMGIKDMQVNGTVEPVANKEKRVLCLGDSITGGGNVHWPSNNYTVLFAEAMDMELWNQGISGATFYADTLDGLKDIDVTPDLITVAFGTNDWANASSREQVLTEIDNYFTRLRDIYPDIPMVVLTPLWRADWEIEGNFGSFEDLRKAIADRASEEERVLVVDGSTLLPQDVRYLNDGFLHPNDAGHQLVAENLASAVTTWMDQNG